MSRRGIQAAVVAFLVAATAWIALALLPFDSDGALAVHDGVYYGMGAERDALAWILPHHPLFHGIAAGLVPVLRALGAAHPGHLAVRIISGLGAIWLLVQIVRLAGRDRALVGGAFAALLLATRGFLVETAGGETVLPAAAAALFALWLASRPDPRPWAVGVALAFAVLLRLDNVLLVPGVAVGLFSGLPRGRRGAGVVGVLVCAGLVTLLAYIGAWMIRNDRGIPFDRWLLPSGFTPWLGARGFTLHRFALYATGFLAAAAGQIWRFGAVHPWSGLGVVAAILAAGLLLRGTHPDRRLLAPVLVTLAFRAVFHTWFEADNFEWLVFPLASVVAIASAMARGAPATRLAAKCGGIAIIAALVVWMLASHLPTTWRIRGRQYMSAVEEAAGAGAGHVRWLAQGETPGTALALLGVPFERIEEAPVDRPEASIDLVLSQLKAHPVETVVVLSDRFVVNGQPHMMQYRDFLRFSYDEVPDGSYDGFSLRFFRREGLTIAIRIAPEAAGSRADTR